MNDIDMKLDKLAICIAYIGSQCDWGWCESESVTVRWDGKRWLPVCYDHRCDNPYTPQERVGSRSIVDVLKVVICDAMLAINAEGEPYPPIIPPTAIDWIGDRLAREVASNPATGGRVG